MRVLKQKLLVTGESPIYFRVLAGTKAERESLVLTGLGGGSKFEETDTGKTYTLSEEAGSWTEVSAGGGSGGCVYGMDDWSNTGL